ncbi:MAG: PTS sugar transporter subunit IIC [Sphaerochaetaceae bacterium]|nr:PTS sugar transporter subunit IIC [Sphaerochaetaceae bacterium]
MNKYVKRYLVDALGGMALGLFSTLILGLILKQIGEFFPGLDTLSLASTSFYRILVYTGQFFIVIGKILTVLTGAGIAVGVAHALDAPKLAIFASVLTGTIGAYSAKFIVAMTSNASALVSATGAITLSGPGDPLGAFIAALVGAELGRLVYKKTKIDIIIVPAVTVIAGTLTAIILGPPLSSAAVALGAGIQRATELQPFWMGIILAVVMGMLLTLPVSSAAIAIILGMSGLAGGASVAGCSAQMIGFAVISFKDNGFNGLFAQGIGTSMLQIPNIAKNPRIWIPPILASVVTGPISTVLFKMETLPAGAGMGTSGLVGQIMTYQAMAGSQAGGLIILKILIVQVIVPALLSLVVYFYMRKKGWIKDGDMRLTA